ncbi:hypothetical protein [Neorhizobium sp. T25_13]|uniref:hypothetical protein n=1 Tax=Neorhizobium sp. T25_13 TaxID=2093830 RepID=UPI00155F0B53|nr:hypothetical protein [Neorhizobium sp. T25_13]
MSAVITAKALFITTYLPMRLISIKPNAESKLYGLLQSQFACRRNIWREKPVRHFCAYGIRPESRENQGRQPAFSTGPRSYFKGLQHLRLRHYRPHDGQNPAFS